MNRLPTYLLCSAAAAILVCGIYLYKRPGPLVSGVDRLVAGWTENKVPPDQRTAILVLADGSSGGEALALPPDPADFGMSGSRTAELKGWLYPLKTETAPTRLGTTFADVPDAVVWTHDGLATATEGPVVRELTRAIVKARDAGARVNIVAQGISAAPVYQALKGLESVQRSGTQVGADKVVFLGMNEPRFKRITAVQAYGLGRPTNAAELANLWAERGKTMLRLSGAKDLEIALEILYPGSRGKGLGLEPAELVKTWVTAAGSMQEQVDRVMTAKKKAEAAKAAKAAAKLREAEARKASEEAAKKAAAAQRAAAEAARRRAAAQPQDESPAIPRAFKTSKSGTSSIDGEMGECSIEQFQATAGKCIDGCLAEKNTALTKCGDNDRRCQKDALESSIKCRRKCHCP